MALNRLIAENGFSFSALQRKEDGALIGICGLHRGGLAPLFPEETVEIGWRLLPDYWGKGYVSEAARACLAHGFEAQGLDEIVAFAVHDNYRSLAVMERIGMRHAAQRDFEHPGIDDRFSHLRPHRTYAISRRDWLAAQA